ncbi:hypothetical protein QBC35DRAFT_157700 [Podospora australis]|uniref:Uncharacterized protein n=1 Tax=Podospora australis TaxID=1536484 RepID=A0AAN7ABI4_9PEZI|nr:hypothetical protein QBC35DRAFT_157700 [Podospora australis]
MSFQYRVTEDASLFGLNVALDAHLLRLQADTIFSHIRRDIERNITTLKTLTPNSFGKRRSKDSFKDNVELVVNGAPESGAFMPLVEKLGSDDVTRGESRLGTDSSIQYNNLLWPQGPCFLTIWIGMARPAYSRLAPRTSLGSSVFLVPSGLPSFGLFYLSALVGHLLRPPGH